MKAKSVFLRRNRIIRKHQTFAQEISAAFASIPKKPVEAETEKSRKLDSAPRLPRAKKIADAKAKGKPECKAKAKANAGVGGVRGLKELSEDDVQRLITAHVGVGRAHV